MNKKVALNFTDITALNHREKRLQQNQEQLVALNTELREQVSRLTSEILITEQRVLEYVAQLLHDDLQQHLTFILMKIHTISQLLPPSELTLQTQIQELREATDLAFAITRQVAVDLNPPIVLNEDFVESLSLLGKVMKKRYGLKAIYV